MKKIGPDEKIFNQHIGATIGIRRVQLGMSQKDIAQQIGVSFQQVQKYESGVTAISVYKLHKIFIILGISLASYFECDFTGPDTAEKNIEKIRLLLSELEQEILKQ